MSAPGGYAEPAFAQTQDRALGSTVATPPATGPHRAGGVAHHDGAYLYRCYDATGALVYVGRSQNPEQRWDWWKYNRAWSLFVHERTLDGPYSVEESKRAELEAIHRERPMLNITGNPDYLDLSREGRKVRYTLWHEVLHVRHVRVATGLEMAVSTREMYDADRIFPRTWPADIAALSLQAA